MERYPYLLLAIVPTCHFFESSIATKLGWLKLARKVLLDLFRQDKGRRTKILLLENNRTKYGCVVRSLVDPDRVIL
jgi:hypothetical protein